MTTYIKVGQVINTHGVRGEIKVYPLTDEPERFFELKKIYIDKKEYTIEKARLHKGTVILSLQGIDEINQAEPLKGRYAEIPLFECRPLDEGQYYVFQIIGLDVWEKGEMLGTIRDVIKTGSNDVYLVRRKDGKEICVPALKEVVKNIDFACGKMEVELPPGLLD